MLDDMAHDLLIFQEYEFMFKSNVDLEETLVKAFIEVIHFCSLAIQYLKKNPAGISEDMNPNSLISTDTLQ